MALGVPFDYNDYMREQMAESEEFRFRSYAERYVLARAPTFREGHEDEDAWQATLQAQGAYKRIAEVAKGFRPSQFEDAQPTQAVYPNGGGATGPTLYNPPTPQLVHVKPTNAPKLQRTHLPAPNTAGKQRMLAHAADQVHRLFGRKV